MWRIQYVAWVALAGRFLLGATPDDFAMRIVPATSSIEGVFGSPSRGSVELVVTMDSAIDEVQGWTFYAEVVPAPSATLQITAVAVHPDMLTVKNGSIADWLVLHYHPLDEMHGPGIEVPGDGSTTSGLAAGAVNLGIIPDFELEDTLAAVTGLKLAIFTVDVSGPAGRDPVETGRVVFSGAPPEGWIGTQVLFEGMSYRPAVQDPAVIVIAPPCAPPTDYSIWLSGGECDTGDTVTSVVSLNFDADESIGDTVVMGWAYGVCTDALLTVIDTTTDGTDTATVKDGSPPDFDFQDIYPDGVTHGVVIDRLAIANLLPRNDFRDLRITMTAGVDAARPIANIRTCDSTLGSPLVPNVVTIMDISLPASRFDGVLADREWGCCEDALGGKACNRPAEFKYAPGRNFVPGSANGDGRLDIADGIYLLNYLFRRGPALPCLKAADANGDCAVDSADAVYIVYYLFHPDGAYPAPTHGLGCQFVRNDVCPSLSCEIEEDCALP